MQYEFDTPMTSQKSIPGAVSKATCLTREDAMTASRCMCLSWCLRSTCDDFFQAKETSIKGRLIKVRLESLGTAIFQRSRYTLAAHNWSMPFTNCSSIQEESTLDQHSPVHEIFNYLTATFPVHHYPEPDGASRIHSLKPVCKILTWSCQPTSEHRHAGQNASFMGAGWSFFNRRYDLNWRSGPVVGA